MTLGKEYTWQHGDTLAVVAIRYRRPAEDYKELVDLNKALLQEVRYQLREGDVIKIPESWFPIPGPSYTTKFEGSSSRGHRF